ncbi:hypothetical protein LINGRAHAP2_LOCUS902 [Linum grandiflorum]
MRNMNLTLDHPSFNIPKRKMTFLSPNFSPPHHPCHRLNRHPTPSYPFRLDSTSSISLFPANLASHCTSFADPYHQPLTPYRSYLTSACIAGKSIPRQLFALARLLHRYLLSGSWGSAVTRNGFILSISVLITSHITSSYLRESLFAMDTLPPNVIPQGFMVAFPPEDANVADADLSLIGRVFWPLPKPIHNLQQAMARRWRISPQSLEVFEVPHGLIQFVFPTEEEKVRIFQSQPWAFKSAIISLVPWELPTQDLFDRLQFQALTIQLKDLPSQYNNMAFGSKLVQPLGALVDAGLFSTQPGGQGSRFVKCIIKIDLLKSIHGRIQARFGGRHPFWVRLRYEDLPTVCFTCGLLGHGHDHCPYSGILTWNHQERGPWMLAKPHGHKVEIPDLTDASTSKQKAKYLKPVPYVFHTYVLAGDGAGSSSGPQGPASSGIIESGQSSHVVTEAPICSNLQDMQLGDRKRHREEVLDFTDCADSLTTPKRIRRAPPLTLADFPDNDMDLELLPDDLLDSDPDMIAVSAALSTSKVEAANHNRPPHPP